jgi:hypothetical protein
LIVSQALIFVILFIGFLNQNHNHALKVMHN